MSDKPDISQILAALGEPCFAFNSYYCLNLTAYVTAAQRPGGTPTQSQPLPQQSLPIQSHFQQQPPPQAYPTPYPPTIRPGGGPTGLPPYALPKPVNSGSIDLSNVKPVHSGSVSLADAVTRARSIAADKGFSQNGVRGNGSELAVFFLLQRVGTRTSRRLTDVFSVPSTQP